MHVAEAELVDRAVFVVGMVEVVPMRVRNNSQGAEDAQADDGGDR